MADFILNNRLDNDTYFIADMKLSRLLLMNDCRYPWVILVPRKNDIKEIYQLNDGDRYLLMDEINILSKAMTVKLSLDKINIGALGNIVSQLHIHIIGRYFNDAAWPNPVWGDGDMVAYDEANAASQCEFINNII